MTRELNMLYVHDPDGSGSIGYARMGIAFAREMQRLGIDIYDDIPEPGPDPSMDHGTDRRPKVCNIALWHSVPTHARGWWNGQSPRIFTMWESSVLPESFRENLHEFDQVIVPSQQNVELFSNYHDNVAYVPLGVDPERWHYTPREMPTRFFRFLIGGSGPRKGTDLAHKAFRRVFKTWPREGPVPMLVLKNPRGEEFYGERVEMVTGKLSPQAEVDLYSSAHAYLQPSRGEGFGLQPLQALAQGVPTILTDAHGHAAFAHMGHGLSSSPSQSAYFIYGDAGEWWEPDFEELCEWMDYVYNHYERCLAKAKRSAEEVARDWTWEVQAQKLIDVLGDGLNQPYSGNHSWHLPASKRYLVILNRNWTADIAGSLYHFEAGKRYWELADVKRVLFEAGHLDPACITNPASLTRPPEGQPSLALDDTGLTEEQVKKIPNYTAAHSHCPTCHQRLNSSPSLADELYAEMVQQ